MYRTTIPRQERQTSTHIQIEVQSPAFLARGEQVGTAVGNQRRPAKVQVTLYAYLHMNR